MQRRLGNFAYRAEFGTGLFLITPVLAVTIAGLIVSYQAVRAALLIPVETLWYE